MIQIKNEWYGAVQVLNDCAVSITKGDVVMVCGPSGSGESTLIKTVNALEPFQKGEITVDGIPLHDPRTNLPALRAKVGVVFQHFELFPHLSFTENIAITQIKVLGRNPQESNARGLKMLDRVGLVVHKKPVSRPVVRRPAAARGDRPCTVDGRDRQALRRTYLGARPGDARRSARRDGEPGQGRHDHDGRDARSGIRTQGCEPRDLHRRRRPHPGRLSER